MSNVILTKLVPCLEDVVNDRELNNIVFDLQLNDVFDKFMYADLKVIKCKNKDYENANYIICKDCFDMMLSE